MDLPSSSSRVDLRQYEISSVLYEADVSADVSVELLGAVPRHSLHMDRPRAAARLLDYLDAVVEYLSSL